MSSTKKAGVRDLSYIDLLEKIFLAGTINRVALIDTNQSRRNINKLLKKALTNNHIKERTYKEIYGRRNRLHKYYTITISGLRYLAENGQQEWTNYIQVDDVRSITSLNKDWRPSAIAYNVRCGNTLLFAKEMGATLTDFIFSGKPDTKICHVPNNDTNNPPEDVMMEDEDADWLEEAPEYLLDPEEKIAYHKIIGLDYGEEGTLSAMPIGDGLPQTEALQEEQKGGRFAKTADEIRSDILRAMRQSTGKPWSTQQDGLYFFPAREIKKCLLACEKNTVSFTDFAYGQYTGLLVGQKTSVILYHARHDGMPWNGLGESKDLKTMRQFSVKCSPIDNVSILGTRAAILVHNEKNFTDVIRDKFNKRREGVLLGKNYLTVYLFPISGYGVSLALWLVTNSEADRLTYADSAAASLGLRRNQRVSPNVFRYEDRGTPVINGLEMDAKKLLLAQAIKERGDVTSFEVLCFQWQAKHYATLWPDAKQLYVDVDGP